MADPFLGRRLVAAVRLARWERRVELAILRAHRAMLRATLSELSAALTAAAPFPYDDNEWDRLLEAELRPVSTGIMGELGGIMLGALPGDLAFFPEFDFTEQANRLVERARGIGPAVAERITAGLQQGAGRGEGITELRNRVQDAFASTEYRARMIARTEVVSATNGASHAGAGAMVAGGMAMDKLWLAALDSRTRRSHRAANGQRVAYDQQFTVGGAAMDYPGDPGGPADEVVNCRCTLTYEPVEEATSATKQKQDEVDDRAFPSGPMTEKQTEAWMAKQWTGKTVLLGGLGPRGARDVAETMHALLRRFPETASRVNAFGSSSKMTAHYKDVAPGTRYPGIGRAIGDAARKVGGIRINAAKAKDYDATLAMMRENVEVGFLSPGTADLTGAVRHEFGHFFKWTAEDRVGAPAVRQALDAVVTRHADELRATAAAVGETLSPGMARYRVMRGLSRYGATDYDEMVAESFAEYYGPTETRSLANDVIDVIRSFAES